jgi:hypothetical protein
VGKEVAEDANLDLFLAPLYCVEADEWKPKGRTRCCGGDGEEEAEGESTVSGGSAEEGGGE